MDDRLSLLSSSPRLRGAPGQRIGGLRGARLIPASAGSTTPHLSPEATHAAHPRVCGEHITPGDNDITHLGSSPRLRGAHTRQTRLQLPHRLIPASAGSTGRGKLPPGTPRAHPRVCGEHPAVRVDVGLPHGLIPASAGSTCLCVFHHVLLWAHPRVCGEH